MFKHVGSFVDLFSSCQLHISFTKYVKIFFKVFDQGKSHYVPGDIGGGEGGRCTMRKVTNGDMGRGGGSKIWRVRGDVVFEWSQYNTKWQSQHYISNFMSKLK